jgi:hypothetical protein
MVSVIDLTGQQFGLLFVMGRVANKRHGARWLCWCECGKSHDVDGVELRRGNVRSCGCATRSMIGAANTKHGLSRTPAYRAWAAMMNRCRDTTHTRYGGRGITVCERWRSFDNFYADMGDPPVGMSLERKNNNSGYSKRNCVWATTAQQNKNRSNSRVVKFNGVRDTIAAHASRVGLRYDTVYKRIVYSGWTVRKALTTKPFGTRVEVPL